METITRNLEDLLAFHEVATGGSFTRAAEALGTSKSQVSKRVRRMESAAGAKLFHRTTRSLHLTPEGTALLRYSEKIVGLAEAAQRRLRDIAEAETGTLRISAAVSFGDRIFPSLFPRLRAALPRVHFDLDLTNENRLVREEGVDFALRAMDDRHPDLVARPLGQLRDAICAAPSLIAKAGAPEHPTALAKLPAILHGQNAAWNEWTLRRGEEEVRVRAKGRLRTNQYGLMRTLCRRGLGVARIPYYYVAADLRAGRLVELCPDYRSRTHPLFLLYLRPEFATRKHSVTKEILLRWFAEHPEIFA